MVSSHASTCIFCGAPLQTSPPPMTPPQPPTDGGHTAYAGTDPATGGWELSTEEAPRRSNRTLLTLLIVVLVLSLGLLGFAVWYALTPDEDIAVADTTAVAAEEPASAATTQAATSQAALQTFTTYECSGRMVQDCSMTIRVFTYDRVEASFRNDVTGDHFSMHGHFDPAGNQLVLQGKADYFWTFKLTAFDGGKRFSGQASCSRWDLEMYLNTNRSYANS